MQPPDFIPNYVRQCEARLMQSACSQAELAQALSYWDEYETCLNRVGVCTSRAEAQTWAIGSAACLSTLGGAFQNASIACLGV